jgi:hypothetical protein
MKDEGWVPLLALAPALALAGAGYGAGLAGAGYGAGLAGAGYGAGCVVTVAVTQAEHASRHARIRYS